MASEFQVRALVGDNAITREIGRSLYDRIHPLLLQGEAVDLDFSGVRVYASPFFNAAIGLLYKDLTPEVLNARLGVRNLTPAGRSTLRMVIDTARKTYASEQVRQAFESAVSEELLAE